VTSGARIPCLPVWQMGTLLKMATLYLCGQYQRHQLQNPQLADRGQNLSQEGLTLKVPVEGVYTGSPGTQNRGRENPVMDSEGSARKKR